MWLSRCGWVCCEDVKKIKQGHRVAENAIEAYELFENRCDNVIKVAIKNDYA